MQLSNSKKQWLVVTAAAILCFVNILPNDFCFDDVSIVRDNSKVQAPGQWTAIWITDYWSHSGQDAARRDLLYRPVTLSLFRAIRMAAGSSPIPFHVISLLLHALCSVLVALLVARLLRNQAAGCVGDQLADGSARTWREVAPLAAGLLFAVLPIHSEVVASVVGQADLLATAATLGAILCHFKAFNSPIPRQKYLWMALAALLAFLAMGAKESGIGVVPLIGLAALLGLPTITKRQTRFPTAPHLDKEGLGGGPTMPTSRFILLTRCAYLLTPMIAYLALRYYALGGALHQAPAPTKTVNVLVDAPPWQHALGVLQAWGMYWVKTIFPRVLAIEYAINSVRLPSSLWQFHVLVGLIWCAALAAAAIVGLRNNRRELVFLPAALILCYMPTSNAFVLIQVFFAERIWYLPSVFAVGLFAAAATWFLRRPAWRKLGIAMLAVMMIRCWVRNGEWKNNGTLYAATYYDHPASVMARHLYGQWLTQNGDLDRGIDLLLKAIEIDLGFTDAHRALGRAYFSAGKPKDALRHLQIADMQAPGHIPTQTLLKDVAVQVQSELAQQLETARQVADSHPDDVDKQLVYVRLLRESGQTEQALGVLQGRAGQFDRNPDWVIEMAITLVYMDRRDDAISAYRRALQLQPENSQYGVELAMLLIERGRDADLGEAEALVGDALKRSPDNPGIHAAAAEVQLRRGDVPAARQSLTRAIQLSEPGTPFARMLEERRRSLGQ